MVKIHIFSLKSICRPRLKSISYLLHFAVSCLAHLYLYELTLPSCRILISRPFKFIIGPDEVLIVVHKAVFAEQSPVLAALMRGEMAESVAGESR
jgi:hypothetical protein